MTAREFAVWVEEYRVRPWGPVREDMAAGVIAASVINCAGGNVTVGEVMPYLSAGGGKRYATDDETLDFLKGFTA